MKCARPRRQQQQRILYPARGCHSTTNAVRILSVLTRLNATTSLVSGVRRLPRNLSVAFSAACLIGRLAGRRFARVRERTGDQNRRNKRLPRTVFFCLLCPSAIKAHFSLLLPNRDVSSGPSAGIIFDQLGSECFRNRHRNPRRCSASASRQRRTTIV